MSNAEISKCQNQLNKTLVFFVVVLLIIEYLLLIMLLCGSEFRFKDCHERVVNDIIDDAVKSKVYHTGLTSSLNCEREDSNSTIPKLREIFYERRFRRYPY